MKEIIALYNNRSAMYLADGNPEKALQDITILLAMDPKHIKARNRRAKIFEEQVIYYPDFITAVLLIFVIIILMLIIIIITIIIIIIILIKI